MNYIKQLNGFYSTLDYKPLPTNAIAVYTILLQIANRTGWIDEFKVANSILMSKCDLDKQKLIRARNYLSQQGYIKYKKGKNQTEMPAYSIVQLYDNTANNTPDDTADDTADDTNNKQNKTKLTYCSTEKELADNFDKIWKIYPRKEGKDTAFKHYKVWLKGKKYAGRTVKLDNRQMWYAVKGYADLMKEKQTERKYIKTGGVFFNEAIIEYVKEEKQNE